MEIVYVIIGVVIGVVGVLALDISSFADLFAKKEEKFDDKNEENEGK